MLLVSGTSLQLKTHTHTHKPHICNPTDNYVMKEHKGKNAEVLFNLKERRTFAI